MLLSLVVLRTSLLEAHLDGTIQYFSSDAATYFSLYSDVYEDIELTESFSLFMIGSPILFMKLTNGNLYMIQLLNLLLMGFALKVALDCLPSSRAGAHFLLGALIFPYFVFGFLSLNKEVYAMCSAILFGGYLIRGRLRDLFLALILAMCARYYMVLTMLVLVMWFPRLKQPRYMLIIAVLLLFSITAPAVKEFVPDYSWENVLDESGMAGLFFSWAIDAFAYAIIYPFKYIVLILQRAYSFILSTGREADTMEAVVSIATVWVLLSALKLLSKRHNASFRVRQLIIAGLTAPIPMMWGDIMHWRYYSYVYFFFLYAIVVHASEKKKSKELVCRQLDNA